MKTHRALRAGAALIVIFVLSLCYGFSQRGSTTVRAEEGEDCETVHEELVTVDCYLFGDPTGPQPGSTPRLPVSQEVITNVQQLCGGQPIRVTATMGWQEIYVCDGDPDVLEYEPQQVSLSSHATGNETGTGDAVCIPGDSADGPVELFIEMAPVGSQEIPPHMLYAAARFQFSCCDDCR